MGLRKIDVLKSLNPAGLATKFFMEQIMDNEKNKRKQLKTMKTLLTFALALSLGASTFANTEKESIAALSNVKVHDQKVNVSFQEGLGKVKLSILNESGQKLHQQTFKVKENLMMPYDLSNLPEGEYYFMIESKNGEEDDKAVYTVTSKAAPEELPLMAYGKALDKTSFRLAVVGLEQPGVDVRIWHNNGKVIFTENINQEEGFSKVYHVDNMTVKDVSVQVTDAKGRTKYLYF